ncbi:hypothetical protein [Gluconacetobacter sp.]|uniref:hypothetical protein n=1 Tax=Gluconacetobacter sp. TaxID=1935994 RepID=UPI0039E843D2
MTPWRCWHELHASRGGLTEGLGAGMGKQKIFSRPVGLAVNEIDAWCRNQDLVPRQSRFVRHLVIVMDRAYLTIRAQQISEELQVFFS